MISGDGAFDKYLGGFFFGSYIGSGSGNGNVFVYSKGKVGKVEIKFFLLIFFFFGFLGLITFLLRLQLSFKLALSALMAASLSAKAFADNFPALLSLCSYRAFNIAKYSSSIALAASSASFLRFLSRS